MLDEVKGEIEIRHQMIKDHMEQINVTEMTHSGYKVTWKPITITTISAKALQKEAPEVYEMIAKKVETMRFKIAAAAVDAHH